MYKKQAIARQLFQKRASTENRTRKGKEEFKDNPPHPTHTHKACFSSTSFISPKLVKYFQIYVTYRPNYAPKDN